jgi:hypothetical protein
MGGTKSPTNTKSKSGKSTKAANQATKKTAKPAKNATTPTTPTSQQHDQTSGSPSSAVLRNQRAAKRGNNQQGSNEKTLGTIPKKLKMSKLVDSTGGTMEQDETKAKTDEKVDPPEETKDPEDPAAKSTKVPTDPEAPAAMSDEKSSGANSDEKQTAERKGNNIGDNLQAKAGKKNSSPPNAEITNNTDQQKDEDNQSQLSDSDAPAFFSSVEEVGPYFSSVEHHQDDWFQSDDLPAKKKRLYESIQTKLVGLLPEHQLNALAASSREIVLMNVVNVMLLYGK